MISPNGWQSRHEAAMAQPTELEFPLVYTVRCLGALTGNFYKDHVLREGVALMLLGTRQILCADWGPRLDMGSIDQMLVVCAEAMNYDLDTEEFR